MSLIACEIMCILTKIIYVRSITWSSQNLKYRCTPTTRNNLYEVNFHSSRTSNELRSAVLDRNDGLSMDFHYVENGFGRYISLC